MDIKLFQMLTGDLLIGELTNATGEIITIQNPLRVIVLPAQNNKNTPSIALAPFCEFSDDKEFTFKVEHVIAIMNPVSQFVSQYRQTFGKVLIPTGGLILPE